MDFHSLSVRTASSTIFRYSLWEVSMGGREELKECDTDIHIDEKSVSVEDLNPELALSAVRNLGGECFPVDPEGQFEET